MNASQFARVLVGVKFYDILLPQCRRLRTRGVEFGLLAQYYTVAGDVRQSARQQRQHDLIKPIDGIEPGNPSVSGVPDRRVNKVAPDAPAASAGTHFGRPSASGERRIT